jgi:hypothetical protein
MISVFIINNTLLIAIYKGIVAVYRKCYIIHERMYMIHTFNGYLLINRNIL